MKYRIFYGSEQNDLVDMKTNSRPYFRQLGIYIRSPSRSHPSKAIDLEPAIAVDVRITAQAIVTPLAIRVGAQKFQGRPL